MLTIFKICRMENLNCGYNRNNDFASNQPQFIIMDQTIYNCMLVNSLFSWSKIAMKRRENKRLVMQNTKFAVSNQPQMDKKKRELLS